MIVPITRAVAAAAVLAAVAAFAPGAVAPAAAVVGDCTAQSSWGTARQDLAPRVLELVNQHRAAKGLQPLKSSPTLTSSALWKSRHMAYYRYLQHADPAPPVARTVADRLEACGYPSRTAGWGENIAYGYASPEAVVSAWLNSSGHRANIESASFRTLGVGVAAASTGTLYWTQNFGTYDDSGSSTPPAPSPAPPPSTTASAFPGSATIFTGFLRSGSASRLAADDNQTFQVSSSSRTTSWYGRMSGIPNTVKSLRVVYRGWNSASCSQTVYLYSWTAGTWRALDSRTVGTTEVEVRATASGTLADYVSGSSGNGDAAVLVRCTGPTSFYAAGDLMKIEYGT